MLLFCDSFDHYSTLSDKYSSVVNTESWISNSTSAAATGVRGLRGIGNNTGQFANFPNDYVRVDFSSTPSTVIMGIRIRPVAGTLVIPGEPYPYMLHPIFSLLDGAFVQCRLVMYGGQLRMYKDSSTILGTSARTLSTSIWSYLELKVAIHNSTGTVEVRVNGETWLTLTGQNTRGGSSNNYANACSVYLGPNTGGFGFGQSANSYQADFDDFYVCDTSGSYNNDFLGDVAIACVLPTGNGDIANFSRGGADSGNNYGQVDETPPNGDTDYVYSQAVGDKDRYTFPAVSGSNIPAVMVWNYAKKDTGGTRAIQATAKLGGTELASGVDLTLSTNYHFWGGLFERDPTTTSAWTATTVNASTFGPKVTV